MFRRLSRTFPAIGLDLAPQLADLTRMTMTAVAPVDTALAAKATATEAHLAVVTTMMTVAVTVHLPELVGPLMITLLHVGVSMILTAATTLLTHTSTAMADLPQEITLPGITHQGTAAMLMITLLLVIGN